MSWPAARNVLVGEVEAVTVGAADGAATGTEGDPAELAELAGLAGAAAPLAGLEAGAAAELVAELQAVRSKAAPASSAPAASGLPLRPFMVNINFPPFNSLSGSASHSLPYDVGRAAVVGSSLGSGLLT